MKDYKTYTYHFITQYQTGDETKVLGPFPFIRKNWTTPWGEDITEKYVNKKFKTYGMHCIGTHNKIYWYEFQE